VSVSSLDFDPTNRTDLDSNIVVADVLEAKLVAIKQRPALRKPSEKPRTGKGARLEQTEVRVEKNRREKAKRDSERDHLERIGSMFKVVGSKHTWTRVDILIFGKMASLIDGLK